MNTDLMKLVNIISQIGGDSKQYQGDSGSSPGTSFSQLLAKQTSVPLSHGSEGVSLEQILPEIDGLMEKIGRHTQTPEFLKELAVQWVSAPGEKNAIVSEYSQGQLLNFLKNLQTTEFSVQQIANPAAGLATPPQASPRPITDVLARQLNSTVIAKGLKRDSTDKIFNSHPSSTKDHLSYLQNHTQLTPAIQIAVQQETESRPSNSFEQVKLTQFLQGLPQHKGDSDALAKSLRQWIESAQPEGKPLISQSTPAANKPLFDDKELLDFAKINGINPDVAATILATTQAPSLEPRLSSQPVNNYLQPKPLLRDDALIAISDQATQALKLSPNSEVVKTALLNKANNNDAQPINSSPNGIDTMQQSTAHPTVTNPTQLTAELAAKTPQGTTDQLKPTVTHPVQLTPELAAKAPQGTTENVKLSVANPVQLTPELAAKAQQGTTENVKPSVANPVQLTPELAAKTPQGTTDHLKPTVANPVQLTPEMAAKAPQGTTDHLKPSAFTQNPSESTARENALLSETTKQPGVLNPPKPQTLTQNLSPNTGSKRSELTPTTDRVNLQESVNTVTAKASTPLMDDLKKFNNPYATQQVGNNLSLKQKTKDLPIKVTSKNNSEIISTSTFIENRTKLRDVAINTAIASASLFKSTEIKPASPKVTDDAIALQVTTSAEHGEEKIKESELRRPGDLTRFNLITARNQQHLQSQMSERVTQMLRAGQWSADMKLNPENLGLIKVNMVMDKEQLKIMFTTQHHNVKELVESSMPRLRESLAESGINLADTSVGRDSQQQRQPGDPDSGDQFDFQTKTAENNSEELTEEKQRSTHDGDLDTFV